MYDGDDIDLMYVLSPHGWSTCFLSIDKQIYELGITHVFGDPIRDLIEATTSLLKGVAAAEFTWWDEPGGNRWTLLRNTTQKHWMKIIITEFSSRYGDQIKDEKLLVEFEIKISHFATLIYFQMKKLAILLKEKSFEQHRSGEFPYRAFSKLEAFFAH